MSLSIVIQFGGNPGCNKKGTFNFTFLVLSALIVNVPFCQEDGGGELCILDILVVLVHTIGGCDLLLNSVKGDKFTLSKISPKSHSHYTIRTRTFKSGRRKNILPYFER